MLYSNFHFISLPLCLLLGLLVNDAQCCCGVLFSCAPITQTTTSPPRSTPPNQRTTPAPPPAVISVCGHNKYYSTDVNRPGSGIIGGVTARTNQYPWLVGVKVGGKVECLANVISERYLLTTANCLNNLEPNEVLLVFGDHDSQIIDAGEFTMVPSDLIQHPQYNSKTFDYDFGLIQLPRDLNLKTNWTVQKICLPDQCGTAGSCDPHTPAYISGWGRIDADDSESQARRLQSAYVDMADQQTCRSNYANIGNITDRQMCAGYLNVGGVDTCLGDGGAPLMSMASGAYELCGLASFGQECASPDFLGGYARVCAALSWIDDVTKNQEAPPPLPTPVAGTCGHSIFYNTTAQPGSGGIVGGVTATRMRYPWLVKIRIAQGGAGYERCGGAIIDEEYVLTAAHCNIVSHPDNFTVLVGEWDTENNTEDGEFAVSVTEMHPHPDYNIISQDHDLMILRLSTPLNFSASWMAQKICLPQSCDDGCAPGTTAFIAGWGKLDSGLSATLPRYLQHAFVPIADMLQCENQYLTDTGDTTLTENMLCAGYAEGGIDSCGGDSGGPLMVAENGYFKICGVTSFGKVCGDPNAFGVYSKVCSQLEWIKETAGII